MRPTAYLLFSCYRFSIVVLIHNIDMIYIICTYIMYVYMRVNFMHEKPIIITNALEYDISAALSQPYYIDCQQ